MTRTPQVDPSARCLEVHETCALGKSLSEADQAHVADCPSCSLLFALANPNSEDGTALFAAVRADVEAERGLSAKLRSLPTPTRVLVAAASIAAVVTTIGVTMPRGRFAPVPVDRVVLVVSVLSALLALTLRLGLRPLQAAPPRTNRWGACFAAGLALPVLFAFGPFPTTFDAGSGTSFVRAALGCFFLGGATGAVVIVALRALDRGVHRSRMTALLAATAGGLTANLALELHCPSTAPAHLLLGHAAVALALVFAYGSVYRARVAVSREQ